MLKYFLRVNSLFAGVAAARWSLAFVIALVLLSGAVAQSQQAGTPRYVIYYNSDASPASSLVGTPYTHVILSFITVAPSRAPKGVSKAPVSLVVPDKLGAALDVIAPLQAEGKKVLISFGGGDMKLADYGGVVGREDDLADAIAGFVAAHGLDGVDIDFEVSAALQTPQPANLFDGRAFLIDLTRALRVKLPPEALLTHVPQAPYLDPGWHGGPYLDVLRAVGDMIDWITVQYYNNPDFDAPVGARIVGARTDPLAWSYAGITSGTAGIGWPSAQTLVGLPVYRADASNGHLAPETVVAEIVCPLRARFGNSFGGLTGWQFSTLTSDHRFWNQRMVSAVRGAHCGLAR